MTPIYIAAPYASTADHHTIDNIRRARALARHASALGYAPMVIHGEIAEGVYGNDNDPEEHARGIEAACAIAAAIGRAGGELWILVPPDGGVSSGCEREEQAFVATGNTRVRYWRMGLDGAISEVR